MKANIFDRIEWILKAARNVARCKETHYRLDEMEYNIYEEYAEPGYSTKNGAIVTGNWNKVDKYDADSRTFTLIDNTPVRVCELLERLASTSSGVTNGIAATLPQAVSRFPRLIRLEACFLPVRGR